MHIVWKKNTDIFFSSGENSRAAGSLKCLVNVLKLGFGVLLKQDL